MIDVGKGYRQLEPGDRVFPEDEFMDMNFPDHGWWSCDVNGYVPSETTFIYRRPISQEKTEDVDEG